MNEKPIKAEIGFQEALRRIAKTPKALVIDDTKQGKVTKNEKRPVKQSVSRGVDGSVDTTAEHSFNRK